MRRQIVVLTMVVVSCLIFQGCWPVVSSNVRRAEIRLQVDQREAKSRYWSNYTPGNHGSGFPFEPRNAVLVNDSCFKEITVDLRQQCYFRTPHHLVVRIPRGEPVPVVLGAGYSYTADINPKKVWGRNAWGLETINVPDTPSTEYYQGQVYDVVKVFATPW